MAGFRPGLGRGGTTHSLDVMESFGGSEGGEMTLLMAILLREVDDGGDVAKAGRMEIWRDDCCVSIGARRGLELARVPLFFTI